MDLNEARKLAEELIALHAPDGWTFSWSQSKTSFGECLYWGRRIVLSHPLTRVNNLDHVKDTLLHEIAHANCPGAGHGPKWRAEARRLGAIPLAAKHGEMAPARYVLVCPRCQGAAGLFYRRPTVRRSCKKCGPPRFDPDFAMTPRQARADEVLEIRA